ncbi:hypothetical protein [Streptomyces mirabilis]|uniref:hypothetical protein n=1 Tax=Streptomyces mirabilis TaxID=68239 RepID=UPI0036DA68FD
MHRYTGTDIRDYPYARIGGGTVPLHAEPGMEPVEFDEPPADGRWEEVKPAPTKKAPSAAKSREE